MKLVLELGERLDRIELTQEEIKRLLTQKQETRTPASVEDLHFDLESSLEKKKKTRATPTTVLNWKGLPRYDLEQAILVVDTLLSPNYAATGCVVKTLSEDIGLARTSTERLLNRVTPLLPFLKRVNRGSVGHVTRIDPKDEGAAKAWLEEAKVLVATEPAPALVPVSKDAYDRHRPRILGLLSETEKVNLSTLGQSLQINHGMLRAIVGRLQQEDVVVFEASKYRGQPAKVYLKPSPQGEPQSP